MTVLRYNYQNPYNFIKWNELKFSKLSRYFYRHIFEIIFPKFKHTKVYLILHSTSLWLCYFLSWQCLYVSNKDVHLSIKKMDATGCMQPFTLLVSLFTCKTKEVNTSVYFGYLFRYLSQQSTNFKWRLFS